ncbi:hypothetical protein EST38_g804 [Candolleomyces aberdarensis]|uniref:Peptidase A1 domain-containing protein n=1 Tax=Candolleomyces aberdarensis TaxID=2316362 RepID=A0A4Q2E125_9AGAR|nr:hypothetical protein EST38_g804 [Candolleomyces aberdarensis]
MFSLPFTLSILFLSELASAAETFHIPLQRRAQQTHDLDYYSAAADNLRAKYNIGSAAGASTGRRRAAVENIPVINQGTTIQYGSGAVAGSINRDVVTMSNFTIQNQVFLGVDRLQSGLLDGQTSGILGLAFQTIASTGGVPFWQNLLNDDQLESPEFSFWLARSDSRGDDSAPGGVFTLGGTNSSLYSGEIEFLDMPGSRPSYWLLPLQSVTVQGERVSIATGNSALSAIDTGTTLIGGPSDDVASIWAQVPGATQAANQQGFWTFPCSTEVNVTMSFGGRSWAISSEDMNLGPVTTSGRTCAGAIFDLNMGSNIPAGSGPSWVVGATFLKNVYSVYRANPPSIGFAELSTAAGGTGTAPGSRSTAGAGSILPKAGLASALSFISIWTLL